MEDPEPAVPPDLDPTEASLTPRLDVGPGDPSLRGFAADLGVFGNEALEMPIALHLVTGEPLLCGGPPGSAKSLLLCACYRALGLATITPNMAFAGVIEDLSGRRCGLRKA